MGEILKATDEGFRAFALRFDDYIAATGSNPEILNLQTIGLGTGGIPGDGTYNALLAGNGKGFVPAGLLADRYKAFCGALYTAISGTGKTLHDISVDLQMAKETLHNGEQEALTEAQFMTLLADVLGGGSTTVKPPGP